MKAIQLSTHLAGGQLHPIIPIVDGDNKLADSLTKLFSVDLLYPVSDAKEVTEYIEVNKHLSSMSRFGDLIFENNASKKKKIKLLDISYGFDKPLESETYFLPTWDEKDKLNTVFTAQYGKYISDMDLYHDYSKVFVSITSPKEVTLSSSDSIDGQHLRATSPIEFTLAHIETRNYGYGWNYHGLFFGKTDNAKDLTAFWNLRASGQDLLFIPLGYEAIYIDSAKVQYDAIDAWSKKQRFPTGVGVWRTNQLTEDDVKVSLKLLKLDASDGWVNCTEDIHLWNGHNINPDLPSLTDKTVIGNVDYKHERPTITFQLPDMPVSPRAAKRERQELMLDIRVLTEFEYEGYTLQLPNLPDLNPWYGRNVAFALDDFRVSEEGFSLNVDTHDSIQTINPIKHDELIKRLFERADIIAKDSQAGLITQRLVEQLGSLEGARVFKVTGVRKLIEDLKTDGFVTRSEAKLKILDTDPVTGKASLDNHSDLHIQYKERPSLKNDEVFDYLLSNNLFRAGMEIECPSCHLPQWLSIDDLKNANTCEYCGFRFEIATQLKDRDWRFRKSGLLGRDNNQEGAIPVILTLLQFLRRSDAGSFKYTTALKLDSKKGTGKIDCETDFAMLDSRTKNKPTIAIGESKTRNEITTQDMANLQAVKASLAASGLEVFLVFTKTAPFSEDEIAMFKQAHKEGHELILMTDKELEPYEPYDYYRVNKLKLPHDYAFSFEDMAQNSYAIYLSDDPLVAEEPEVIHLTPVEKPKAKKKDVKKK